jgi:hypothetical protein
MSFIVQISPFNLYIYLRLKSAFPVGGFAAWTPHQGSALGLLGALSRPKTPRRKLCLHLILYLATPLIVILIVILYTKYWYGTNYTYPEIDGTFLINIHHI